MHNENVINSQTVSKNFGKTYNNWNEETSFGRIKDFEEWNTLLQLKKSNYSEFGINYSLELEYCQNVMNVRWTLKQHYLLGYSTIQKQQLLICFGKCLQVCFLVHCHLNIITLWLRHVRWTLKQHCLLLLLLVTVLIWQNL